MMKQLKPWQKIVAYGSLVFVIMWTGLGFYMIWLMQTQ